MKKIILLLTSCVTVFYSFGQVTSLNENMNTTCPAAAHSPNGWLTFNAVTPYAVLPEGNWTCDLPGGRSGTPGISCTGLYSSPPTAPLTYHLDTSLLISPKLNLSGYSDHIYLNFDTKTTNFNLGAKLEILASHDSTMGVDTSITDSVYNKTTAMSPLFDNSDETDWVTHQVDLTEYKNVVPLYIGFRYTSANGTTGSRWYLDNINTTTIPLPPTSSSKAYRPSQGLSVNGSITEGKMSLFCTAPKSGTYNLAVYDMSGRLINQEQVNLHEGQNNFAISGMTVNTGIYLLKIGNEASLATARINAW